VGTPGTTTIALSTSQGLAQFGSSITFTALFSSVDNVKPTGTATLLDNDVPVGTAAIADGVATFVKSDLVAGTHLLRCSYNGDRYYSGSVSPPIQQTVGKASADLTIESSMNPAVFGIPLTLTAKLKREATGMITFSDGQRALGTVRINNGSASLTVSSLEAGSHFLSATYSGDANYQ
jgi:hypothetical protein